MSDTKGAQLLENRTLPFPADIACSPLGRCLLNWGGRPLCHAGQVASGTPADATQWEVGQVTGAVHLSCPGLCCSQLSPEPSVRPRGIHWSSQHVCRFELGMPGFAPRPMLKETRLGTCFCSHRPSPCHALSPSVWRRSPLWWVYSKDCILLGSQVEAGKGPFHSPKWSWGDGCF